MKNLFKVLGIIAILAVIGFSMAACGGGEKSINSADALKAYLDSQPANSPDKPIKVAMKINENMVEDVREAINSAGKYVSLNLTGSPITTIPEDAGCKNLVGITIPNSVTTIDGGAFYKSQLTSITIGANVDIRAGHIGSRTGEMIYYGIEAFDQVYNNNGKQAGTYTLNNDVWTKR